MDQVNLTMLNIFGYTINLYAVAITVFFGAFVLGLWRAQKSQHLNWLDMLTRDGTKVSFTKILQLLGGITATWVVIKMTLQETLSWDMFSIYLAYVAGVDGYSKFILAKFGAGASDESAVPDRRTFNQDEENYKPARKVSKRVDQEEEEGLPSGSAKAE